MVASYENLAVTFSKKWPPKICPRPWDFSPAHPLASLVALVARKNIRARIKTRARKRCYHGLGDGGMAISYISCKVGENRNGFLRGCQLSCIPLWGRGKRGGVLLTSEPTAMSLLQLKVVELLCLLPGDIRVVYDVARVYDVALVVVSCAVIVAGVEQGSEH